MFRIPFEPWEPEESVGKLWHAFASRLDAPVAQEGDAVDLSEVGGRLAVFFRGPGGSPSVALRPVSEEVSHHRLSWRRKLGTPVETMARASFDGEVLRLPVRLAVFPSREANAALYIWLAAAAAHAPNRQAEDDPLHADLRALAAARAMVRATTAKRARPAERRPKRAKAKPTGPAAANPARPSATTVSPCTNSKRSCLGPSS